MSKPSRRRLRLRARGWSLRRRVVVGFGAFTALFAVLMTATVISLVDFVRKGNEVVNRWEPAAAATQDLFADLVNQETGVRGFVLSMNRTFLQPFEQYSDKQAVDERRLHELVGRYPVLDANLATLQAVAKQWRDETAIPLISLVNSHEPSASSLVDDPDGKTRFDLVRKAAATLSSAVNGVSRTALHDRSNALRALLIALSVSVLLFVAVGLLAWRGLHRWVLAPVEGLALQARDVAEGTGERRIVPTGPPEFIDLGGDVETMRRRIAEELARVEQTSEDLARSNADLEQFAYVASHDLSEPLRKVANFCQLLERQYGEQLDDRAREYIAFAVDGAKRMQALIADLLALSRVGRSTDAFVPVDTNLALRRAMSNLDEKIVEAGGGVGHSDLPIVMGDPTLLVSLFENLVGNAIKYRSEQPPLVVVTAVSNRQTHTWTFAVKDNGIGIEPQYADRVFAIFQRLHLRGEYAGTGIGLALCRRIVEFHGGRIWLDTSATSGATFRFTLPERAS
ncbi:ATP-binding protein [Jatrophihabitans cynanchi]|jgi:signal transduction histidine kinase|uniref:histidine kinase n=1 Tax=Jatrophihabitans cynanchi TaxID=2944128 RepID=A0ABY7JSS2_9ACTN|nr:ATP-binding protein [Jatrophihabitans sp. SB3-54]WAX55085.1 ATP-binding protein [Jatrophihabitans sp. SB3-54]